MTGTHVNTIGCLWCGELAAGQGQRWTLTQQVRGSNCCRSLVKCPPPLGPLLVPSVDIIMMRAKGAGREETAWSGSGRQSSDEVKLRQRRKRGRRLITEAAELLRQHFRGKSGAGDEFVMRWILIARQVAGQELTFLPSLTFWRSH